MSHLNKALSNMGFLVNKQTLKFNNLSLSELGFGASPLGQVYGPVSSKDAQYLVSRAIDQGINYFDVAPYYGNAESILGACLPKNKSKLVLSTKVGRYGPKTFDFSKKRLQSSIESSLKQLKTDYLDIIFCHDIEFANPKELLEEAIPFLETYQKKGVIGAIGASAYLLKPLLNIAKHPSISIILSYANYCLINTQLIAVMDEFNASSIDVINASPLAMGLLSQKGPAKWHPSKDTHTRILELSKTQHLEGESLNFALDQNDFASTLVGFSNITELDFALHCYKNGSKQNYNETFKALKPLRPLFWN